MGKGGASKGATTTAAVAKPWLKKTVTTFAKPGAKAKGAPVTAKAAGKGKTTIKSAPVKTFTAPVATVAKGKGKTQTKGKSSVISAAVKTAPAAGGKGKSAKGGGSWVFVPTGSSPKIQGSAGKAKGGGKKGKGKGKGKRHPAGLKSDFWTTKLEGETREELGGTYSGVIVRYTWAQAWGLIKPDSVALLPKRVKDALKEAAEAAAAKALEKGKEVSEDHEGFLYFRKPDVNHQEGFKLNKDATVTFSLYMDEKGAGAYDVSPA